MAKYSYIAQSSTGESKSGVIEAKDEHQLARTLRQEGLILIRAKLEEKKKKNFEISLPSFGVSLTEKMFFTRNLQIMISAGLPFPRAIATLAAQTRSKIFKEALLNIGEEVTKGKSFSDTLVKYPNIFSELFQNMVRVGEESGTLENVLKTLTLQIERDYNIRSKVRGAMMYPAVIIFAMLGIGTLMLINVVPKLAETFQELEIELPIITKIVVGLATFLVQQWYLVLIILVLLILIFWRGMKTQKGKKIFDKLTLKMPIISPIVKKTNSAYTVRTLSSLISAGVPIVKSLEITVGTLGNVYYREAITEVTEKVRKGEKLSMALEPYQNIYPLTIIQMIAIGEETGETSGILAKLADFFEEEVFNITQNLTSVIEPVLMLIVGAAVGLFAISMFQPIYSMLGSIQ